MEKMNGTDSEKEAGYSGKKDQKVREGMGKTSPSLDKEIGNKSKDAGQYKEVNDIAKQAGAY